MEPSKKDWKLFMEKVPGWQEAYMERLVNEYIEYLSCADPASTKFWTLDKKSNRTKENREFRWNSEKAIQIMY